MTDVKLTRDQERARMAFDKINSVDSSKAKEWKDHYGRVCMRIPTMIQQCGLCQTIAFWQSKGQSVSESAAQTENKGNSRKEAISKFLQDFFDVIGESDFAKAVRESSFSRYQWLTRESLACARWFKRYSEAILKSDLTQPDVSE